MKFRMLSFVAAWTFLIVTGARAQENLPMAEAAKPQAMPFHLKNGFLIEVEGGIGQLEGLKFILDTGTTYSVIDRRVADRFQAVRRPGRVVTFDGFVRVDWAEFPDVHVGPIELHNVSMMVAQLAKSSELSGNADAIIGLDVLNRASTLDISYDCKTVVLKPRDANARGISEGERPAHITLQAMVQGHAIRLLVDTGMEGIVLYEDRIRKRMPSLLTAERKSARMGRLQGETARVPGLRLDGPESNAEVFLMNGPREDMLPGIDGYLGTASLKAKRIELDFEGETVRRQ
jgi:predicted aspartyl protease